jgi:hypothetical protein
MQVRPHHARRPDVLAILLLATLLFHSYIPVGFMPASGTPFLLELCPAYAGAMPAHHEHEHHHHSQTHTDFQDCPFGSSPAHGPVSQLITFEPPGQISSFVDMPLEPRSPSVRPLRAHQPRGPPHLA